MNELLKTMSEDMYIKQYKGEPENDFAFRVCYSALGMWCLKVSCNVQNGLRGISKINQSQVLGTLLQRFSAIYPQVASKFVDQNDATKKFATMLRNIYEETGFLLSDENNNNNVIANFGRGLRVGNKFLYFGYPNGHFSINGLGVFTDTAEQECDLNELLIRDTLTPKEYIAAYFNELDFTERDVNLSELSFFNPTDKFKKISESWGQKLMTKFSIARKSELGPYYRVIQNDASALFFADEQTSNAGTRLVDFEYRRLLFALKSEYKNPIEAKVYKMDEVYSSIYLPAHLPNREYYLLLLLGWPNSKYNIFDKSRFLLRTEFLPTVEGMLNNLGIRMIVGDYND
jgi:hypothetical protein